MKQGVNFMLETLGRYQENNLVRGCEMSRALCPIVSGIGNVALGIIRAIGYALSAVANGWNKYVLKNEFTRPTEFKSAFIQIGWGFLMMIPYLGSEVARIRFGAIANDTAKKMDAMQPKPPVSQNQSPRTKEGIQLPNRYPKAENVTRD